jgi:hypothetical protein
MRYIPLTLLLVCVGQPAEAASPAVTLISANEIWDEAPHSAFTDLVYWKGQFVCAFREGRAHVSTDGRIRILTSAEGDTWKSAAVLKLSGFDLRDAGLSIAPDNRLMLNGGASPRKTDKEKAPTGTFVAFSEDGKIWTKPEVVVKPGRWLWRVIWHDGKAYGIAYASVRPLNADLSTQLLTSDDGLKYSQLVPKLFGEGTPTEATLRFAKDGTMYCLQRRDGEPRWKSAFFGVSRPPYTEWQWHDLGIHVGGPNFIQLPSGKWIAAGRFFQDKTPKTKLAWLDVDKNTIEPVLELPSGGDTSYPGLVWHDDTLWVSYYSSHEGKTNIYLARVRIE